MVVAEYVFTEPDGTETLYRGEITGVIRGDSEEYAIYLDGVPVETWRYWGQIETPEQMLDEMAEQIYHVRTCYKCQREPSPLGPLVNFW